MIFGLNAKGERVPILRAISRPKEQYFCPQCHGELVIKNGKILAPHFAHKTSADCDSFTQDNSDWHKNWVERFPEENREVIIKLKVSEATYLAHSLTEEERQKLTDKCPAGRQTKKIIALTHRADVCINGYVLEFQHTPITQKEFNERTWFFTQAGYKLIWVFDCRNVFASGKIKPYDTYQNKFDSGYKCSWEQSPKFIQGLIPQENKNVKLIFQKADEDEESYLGRVVWAIKTDMLKCNYKNFFMSNFPKNADELVKWVKKKKYVKKENAS